MTADLDEHGRPKPPLAGDEWETLTGFLDYQRATFAWKTSGLGIATMTRTLPPSTMSLAGLIKHLAYVEDDWFGRWLGGEPRWEPWASVDWAATPDWEWESALQDDPADLLELWNSAVERGREATRDIFLNGDLGQLAAKSWADGRAPSVRWILTHMIEEYARHNGHADLLREAIDGLVGE